MLAGMFSPRGGGGSAPSYWPHVKCQLHFEDTDGGTTVTDTGPLATAFTATGTAANRTAGGIWGVSAFEPGSGGSANAANTDFAIGADVPFTIRFWVRCGSGTWAGAEKSICGVWGAAAPALGWLVTIDPSRRPTFYSSPDGTTGRFASAIPSLPNDTARRMVSISRKPGSGQDVFFHLHGVYSAASGPSPDHGVSIFNPAGQPFRVGAAGGGAPFGAENYIDELEVIIGECLYDTVDYTPDTGPFPTY